MTLIAFHADNDHADIITDTLAYTRGSRHLSTFEKAVVLPGLDAAVLTQGSTSFSDAWYLQAEMLASQAEDFDEFNELATAALPHMWELVGGDTRRDGAGRAPSVAFHVGYSPAEGRFKAYAYAGDFGFDRLDVEGLYVMPSPLNVRPGAIELHRLKHHFLRNFGDASPVERLRGLDPPEPPDSVRGWVGLAKAVRRDRGLCHLYSGFKTYIGGDVIHTRLERATATQERVHTFDDAGDEFRQMMAYSLHPLGQLGPCQCDSGRRLVDCCLTEIFDDTCPCGSSASFRDCCRVGVPAAAPAPTAKAGRNEPCPCQSGRKYKKCCALAAV